MQHSTPKKRAPAISAGSKLTHYPSPTRSQPCATDHALVPRPLRPRSQARLRVFRVPLVRPHRQPGPTLGELGRHRGSDDINANALVRLVRAFLVIQAPNGVAAGVVEADDLPIPIEDR